MSEEMGETDLETVKVIVWKLTIAIPKSKGRLQINL